MKRPERIATGLLNVNGIEGLFNRFFNHCAGSSEMTDSEFYAYARECFHQCLNTFYGRPGYNYITEQQERFHDT